MSRTVDPLTIDADTLMAYLASRQLSPEGRKSMIVALRSFYRWAYRRGLIAVDLAAELPSVSVPITEVRPVDSAVLTRARTIADPQTRLAIDLGALMGLRRSEIAAVHADDVTDLGLRVLGKGSRTRIVPIHPRLKDRLHGLTGYAFPGRFAGHCSPDYIADLVQRVMPGVKVHQLRHYFATSVYQRTHDLRSLQKLLGHASIETTQRYVWVDQLDLEAAVRAVA
jgi:site-specific recombinase XerD